MADSDQRHVPSLKDYSKHIPKQLFDASTQMVDSDQRHVRSLRDYSTITAKVDLEDALGAKYADLCDTTRVTSSAVLCQRKMRMQ